MNDLLRRILFLPPQASTVAQEIDTLHYVVIITTMFGAVIVTIAGGWFIFRYRRQLGEPPSRPTAPPPPATWLEGSVVLGLFTLFVVWWFFGFRQFIRLRVPPENAMAIYVTAKQWMWKFGYAEGGHSLGVLYVPVRRPITLIMTSRDVIHSFFVPDFRVKQDVIPGRYTTLWFEVMEAGTHQILCAEYCGAGHSTMRGQVVALEPVDYARWVAGMPASAAYAGQPYVEPAAIDSFAPREALNLVRLGQQAAAEHGCLRCHTTDGSRYIGPTWAGLYRSLVLLQDGRRVTADEAYLTESMMDPTAKQVAGFPLVMPSYQGLIRPADVAAIIEFIKSLAEVEPQSPGAGPQPPSGLAPPAGEIGQRVTPRPALPEQAPVGKQGRPTAATPVPPPEPMEIVPLLKGRSQPPVERVP